MSIDSAPLCYCHTTTTTTTTTPMVSICMQAPRLPSAPASALLPDGRPSCSTLFAAFFLLRSQTVWALRNGLADCVDPQAARVRSMRREEGQGVASCQQPMACVAVGWWPWDRGTMHVAHTHARARGCALAA